MAVSIDDNIVRLEVSVYDVAFMEFFKSKEDLSRVEFSCCFIKVVFLVKELSKVTPRTVVKNKVKFFRSLKGIIQTYYERMLY